MKVHSFMHPLCLILLLAGFGEPALAQIHAAGTPVPSVMPREQTELPAEAPAPPAYVFETTHSLPDETEAAATMEAHFLGEAVATKWSLVRDLYLHKSEVTVGFGNTHTELAKPSIFDSLTKIERHLRKAVRKGEVTEQEAARRFAKYLDLAHLLFYEAGSGDFEQALRQAKSPAEQMALFDSVRFVHL